MSGTRKDEGTTSEEALKARWIEALSRRLDVDQDGAFLHSQQARDREREALEQYWETQPRTPGGKPYIDFDALPDRPDHLPPEPPTPNFTIDWARLQARQNEEEEKQDDSLLRKRLRSEVDDDPDEHEDAMIDEPGGEILPRRMRKRRKIVHYEADPDAPVLTSVFDQSSGRTAANIGFAKTGAKARNRVPTAFALLRGDKDGKPNMSETRQVHALTIDDRDASDLDFSDIALGLLNDEDFQRGGRNYAPAGNQGPHTVAHVATHNAIQSMMGAPIPDVPPRQEKYLNLQHLFTLHVDDPRRVNRILIEEEPRLFGPGCKPDKIVFADDADPARKTKIRDYLLTYQEIYNRLAVFLEQMSSLLDWETDGRTLSEKLNRGADLVERLVNLHPYGTYAWQSAQPMPTKEEMAGGNEGHHRKIFADASADVQERLDHLAELFDGLQPDRQFTNKNRYREFLIGRINLLLVNEVVLQEHELDDIYRYVLVKAGLVELTDDSSAESDEDLEDSSGEDSDEDQSDDSDADTIALDASQDETDSSDSDSSDTDSSDSDSSDSDDSSSDSDSSDDESDSDRSHPDSSDEE